MRRCKQLASRRFRLSRYVECQSSHVKLDHPPSGVSGFKGFRGLSGSRGLNGFGGFNGFIGLSGFKVPPGDDPRTHATGLPRRSIRLPSFSRPSQLLFDAANKFPPLANAIQLRFRSKICWPSNHATRLQWRSNTGVIGFPSEFARHPPCHKLSPHPLR